MSMETVEKTYMGVAAPVEVDVAALQNEISTCLHQYNVLPVASADYVGKVVQYIGATGVQTRGKFYRCIVSSISVMNATTHLIEAGNDRKATDDTVSAFAWKAETSAADKFTAVEFPVMGTEVYPNSALDTPMGAAVAVTYAWVEL